MDVGQHTAGSDGGAAQKSVELLVVADGELDVAGHNSRLLVVLGGVAGKLEDLSREVLKDGGEVHGGTSTDALSVAALLHEAGNTSNGELKSSLGCTGHGASSLLTLASSSFSSCHCVCCLFFVLIVIFLSDALLIRGLIFTFYKLANHRPGMIKISPNSGF